MQSNLEKRLSKLEERSAPAVVLCAEYFAAYPFTEEDRARARAKVRAWETKLLGYDPLHPPATWEEAAKLTPEASNATQS